MYHILWTDLLILFKKIKYELFAPKIGTSFLWQKKNAPDKAYNNGQKEEDLFFEELVILIGLSLSSKDPGGNVLMLRVKIPTCFNHPMFLYLVFSKEPRRLHVSSQSRRSMRSHGLLEFSCPRM